MSRLHFSLRQPLTGRGRVAPRVPTRRLRCRAQVQRRVRMLGAAGSREARLRDALCSCKCTQAGRRPLGYFVGRWPQPAPLEMETPRIPASSFGVYEERGTPAATGATSERRPPLGVRRRSRDRFIPSPHAHARRSRPGARPKRRLRPQSAPFGQCWAGMWCVAPVPEHPARVRNALPLAGHRRHPSPPGALVAATRCL